MKLKHDPAPFSQLVTIHVDFYSKPEENAHNVAERVPVDRNFGFS